MCEININFNAKFGFQQLPEKSGEFYHLKHFLINSNHYKYHFLLYSNVHLFYRKGWEIKT